jgi:hypothetical protein
MTSEHPLRLRLPRLAAPVPGGCHRRRGGAPVTGLRKAALIAIGVLVAAASLVSFAESYRALLDWASHHGLHSGWAVLWPVQLDTFIAVGELALFVAMADRWPGRSRVFAWVVVSVGLGASVAGNVGHIAGTDVASKLTAAVPPLAAAAALTVGLGVLKRVVAMNSSPHPPSTGSSAAEHTVPAVEHTAPEPPAALNGHAAEAVELYAADLASGAVPSIRRIRREMHVGQPRAEQVRAYLAGLAPPDPVSGGAAIAAGQRQSVSPDHTPQ